MLVCLISVLHSIGYNGILRPSGVILPRCCNCLTRNLESGPHRILGYCLRRKCWGYVYWRTLTLEPRAWSGAIVQGSNPAIRSCFGVKVLFIYSAAALTY